MHLAQELDNFPKPWSQCIRAIDLPLNLVHARVKPWFPRFWWPQIFFPSIRVNLCYDMSLRSNPHTNWKPEHRWEKISRLQSVECASIGSIEAFVLQLWTYQHCDSEAKQTGLVKFHELWTRMFRTPACWAILLTYKMTGASDYHPLCNRNHVIERSINISWSHYLQKKGLTWLNYPTKHS